MAFPWDSRPKEVRPRRESKKHHYQPNSITGSGPDNPLNGRGSPMIGILPTIPEIKRISRYQQNHESGGGIAQILPADPPHERSLMLKRKREYAAALEAQIADKQQQRQREQRLERDADAHLMGHTSPFGRPQPKHWQSESPEPPNEAPPAGNMNPFSPEMMARPLNAPGQVDFSNPWGPSWGIVPPPRAAAYLTPWQMAPPVHPSPEPQRIPGQVAPTPRKVSPVGGRTESNAYGTGGFFAGLGAHDTPESRAQKREAQAEILEAQIAEKELRQKERAQQKAIEDQRREEKLRADWVEQRERYEQEKQRTQQMRKQAQEEQVDARRDAMVGRTEPAVRSGRQSPHKARNDDKHLIDIDAEWRAWDARHGKQATSRSDGRADDDVQVGMGRRRSNSRSATPDHALSRKPPPSRPTPPSASPPPGAPLAGSALQSALRPSMPEGFTRRQDPSLAPLQNRPQASPLGQMGDRLLQIQDLAVDAIDEELRLIKRNCADQKARLRKQVEDLKLQASRLQNEQAKALSPPPRWKPIDLLSPMGDLQRNSTTRQSPEQPFRDLRTAASNAYSAGVKTAASREVSPVAPTISAGGGATMESLIGTLEIAESTLIYLTSESSGRAGSQPTESGGHHRNRVKALVTHTDSEASAGPSTAHEPWSSREGGKWAGSPSQLPSSQEKWTMSEMPSSQGKWTMEESQRESPSGGAGSTATDAAAARGLENDSKAPHAEATNEGQDENGDPSPLQLTELSSAPAVPLPAGGTSNQLAPHGQGVASGRSGSGILGISPRSETRSGQTLGDSLAYSRTNSLATSGADRPSLSPRVSSEKNGTGLNNVLDLGKALKTETAREESRNRTPPTARSHQEPWSDGTIRPSSQESSGGERPASGISMDWKGCTQDILMNALIGGEVNSPKRQHAIPPPLPMSRASSGSDAKVSSPGKSPSTLAPVSEWPPQEAGPVESAMPSTPTPSARGTENELPSSAQDDATAEAQEVPPT